MLLCTEWIWVLFTIFSRSSVQVQ